MSLAPAVLATVIVRVFAPTAAVNAVDVALPEVFELKFLRSMFAVYWLAVSQTETLNELPIAPGYFAT